MPVLVVIVMSSLSRRWFLEKDLIVVLKKSKLKILHRNFCLSEKQAGLVLRLNVCAG